MRFQNKTILVTGGAMGIGAATVKRLAQEGADVIIADIDENAANTRIKEIEQMAFDQSEGNIPKRPVDDIRKDIQEKCDIVDVISGFMGLTPAGNNFKGLCPFHKEDTPSFMVSQERKAYKCFGCGESGDMFSFVMKHQKIDFKEAVRLIARKCGIPVVKTSPAGVPVGKAFFQYVDLSSSDSIARMGEEVALKFQSLNGLVNNAGIVRPVSIADTGDHDWHPQIDINLRAPALCAKALLPLLKKGTGHIVNVSSEGGYRPRPGNWVYDASKAGICALTRTMACEFIQHGMRANTVAPGWTVTEMHFGKAENPAKQKKELEKLVFNGAIIQRLARPEEIASAIAFLLSDDASFITGTTIHVDGGRVGH